MSVQIVAVIDDGMQGLRVEVECHITRGLPAMVIVGSANSTVNESKERIRNAILSSGLIFPRKRITLNLAPGDLPKTGTSLDLALAVAVLAASDQIVLTSVKKHIFIGELGLDGNLRPIRGIVGRILAAKKLGDFTYVIPKHNSKQADCIPGIKVIAVNSLKDVVFHLNGIRPRPVRLTTVRPTNVMPSSQCQDSLDQIIDQVMAKRGLQIAAAGGHNILLYGPPGTGKSMLAKAFRSILPPMNQDEVLEVTHIHSLIGNQYEEVISDRPFRPPHHSASYAAMIGGGQQLRPGEVSMSHQGILFLDELPEFNRQTIESLRQPLEDHTVTIARSSGSVTFPANFTLVATANPCPCGYLGTNIKDCQCSSQQIINYRRKLSGPLMDRIDLFVSVESIEHRKLLGRRVGSSTRTIRQSIIQARRIQHARYGTNDQLNASMDTQAINSCARLNPLTIELLDKAADHLKLSSRSYIRTIRIARTIADLEDSQEVLTEHMAEALQFRHRPSSV